MADVQRLLFPVRLKTVKDADRPLNSLRARRVGTKMANTAFTAARTEIGNVSAR